MVDVENGRGAGDRPVSLLAGPFVVRDGCPPGHGDVVGPRFGVVLAQGFVTDDFEVAAHDGIPRCSIGRRIQQGYW